MRIGVMTAAFPSLTLSEVAAWASRSGFQMLEIACWPAGEQRDRKYGGVVHIDVDTLTPRKAAEIKDVLAKNGVEISSLAYYPNPLHPDLVYRNRVIAHLKQVIVGAEMLGVGIVGTFVGRAWNPESTGRVWQADLDCNFDQLMRVWPDIVRFAYDHKVKIAIENCPMLWADTWPGGSNLAHTPALLRRVFEAIPDENLGVNFDPSHLVWQHIDYVRFIRDFQSRIFHVHAKDMDIDEEMLYQDGILGCGFRWQIPRLPGQGLVDWRKLITTLRDVGYDFVLSIEHEDHNWEATEDLVKRGLLLAKRTLELHLA